VTTGACENNQTGSLGVGSVADCRIVAVQPSGRAEHPLNPYRRPTDEIRPPRVLGWSLISVVVDWSGRA
jgi:hypothetical protein